MAEILTDEAKQNLAELIENAMLAIDWVALRGDGRMSLLEAASNGRDEAIKEAGSNVSGGLERVAFALERIADEMAASRRMEMEKR